MSREHGRPGLRIGDLAQIDIRAEGVEVEAVAVRAMTGRRSRPDVLGLAAAVVLGGRNPSVAEII